jgi:hypothetical protein
MSGENERYVTWYALGIIISVLVIGIGWAVASSASANDRIEKHIVAQQSLNDAVIQMQANIANMQKTLDRVANKLNVN